MKQPIVNFALAKPWLVLAASALGFSALLAILLVLSRAPGVQDYFGLKPFFHIFLVLHVNFAVLVWLLSFVSFIWVLHRPAKQITSNFITLIICITGALMMAISPLFGDAEPVMSNYVPVIDSSLFLGGLLLFLLGISHLAWQALWGKEWDFIRLSALIWFVVLLVFFYHYTQLNSLESKAYFEALFWGAGHVLQFVYVLILWLVWRWSNTINLVWSKVAIFTIIIFSVGFMLVFEVGSPESRESFTTLMRWGMLMLLVPMLWWWLKQPKNKLDIATNASALLMALGLFIGLMIENDTVIVTAHYHATNAAVTIGFMGLAYKLLNKFNLSQISQKMINSQVSLYTLGMILYVLGMAGSGWLGVPRKMAVTVDDSLERLSMGIMGLGGAISIVATLIFIAIMIYSLSGQQKLVKELK